MSIQSSSTAPRLEEFSDQLKSERYAAPIQRRYLWVAQRFHDYLERNVSPLRRSLRQSWRISCDGSFEVGASGTGGIQVMLSNGVAATKRPSTGSCGWCTDIGPL